MNERQLHLFKSKRQRGVALPLPLENKTHMALAKTFKVGLKPGWMSQHIPLGELRDPITAARLKGMGTKPGWADFVLIDGQGRHYYLELKRGKAPLSEAQKQFRDDMYERGVPYAVARSYEEAISVLSDWGAIRVRLS